MLVWIDFLIFVFQMKSGRLVVTLRLPACSCAVLEYVLLVWR